MWQNPSHQLKPCSWVSVAFRKRCTPSTHYDYRSWARFHGNPTELLWLHNLLLRDNNACKEFEHTISFKSSNNPLTQDWQCTYYAAEKPKGSKISARSSRVIRLRTWVSSRFPCELKGVSTGSSLLKGQVLTGHPSRPGQGPQDHSVSQSRENTLDSVGSRIRPVSLDPHRAAHYRSTKAPKPCRSLDPRGPLQSLDDRVTFLTPPGPHSNPTFASQLLEAGGSHAVLIAAVVAAQQTRLERPDIVRVWVRGAGSPRQRHPP